MNIFYVTGEILENLTNLDYADDLILMSEDYENSFLLNNLSNEF